MRLANQVLLSNQRRRRSAVLRDLKRVVALCTLFVVWLQMRTMQHLLSAPSSKDLEAIMTIFDQSAWQQSVSWDSPIEWNQTAEVGVPVLDEVLLGKLQELWKELLHKNATTKLNLTDTGEDAYWGGFPVVSVEAPCLLPRMTPTKRSDVVLATHLSVDRLNRLRDQNEFWQGPVSASIYMTSPDQFPEFVQYLRDHPSLREFVTFHVLMEWKVTFYPNNALRDLALHSIVEADYFLVLDADFLTPRDGHPKIQALMQKHSYIGDMMRLRKVLFIFPAFVVLESENSEREIEDAASSPADRQELLHLLAAGKAKNCQNGHYKLGHAPTNFEKWVSLNGTADESPSYYITPQKGFEPYFMGYRPGIPHYWKGFRGWGFDKISFTHEIVVARYSFHVLRDFFAIHLGALSLEPPQKPNNGRVWTEFFKGHIYNTYNPRGKYKPYAWGIQ